MCLLIAAWGLDPEYPLIVGANRDEQLSRPSTTFCVLNKRGPRILGGRDEVAGGTWLAVNEFGVVAGLTNRPVPEGVDPLRRSRGELPIRAAKHRSAHDAVSDLVTFARSEDYNPAWMLIGDRDDLFFLELPAQGETSARALSEGLHILENAPINSGSAKEQGVQNAIEADLASGMPMSTVMTMVLASHHLPQEVDRRFDTEPSARRSAVRVPCVHTENYGTRSSALIMVPSDRREKSFISVADGPPCRSRYQDQSVFWISSRD